MAFAQLTFQESSPDVEACLRAVPRYLYHMGLRCKTIPRTTPAEANDERHRRIFADFAQLLIGEARRLYVSEDLGLHSLYTVLQILTLTVFEKRPLLQVLSNTRYMYPELDTCNQLKLFDF